jgi:hypothetical protein
MTLSFEITVCSVVKNDINSLKVNLRSLFFVVFVEREIRLSRLCFSMDMNEDILDSLMNNKC